MSQHQHFRFLGVLLLQPILCHAALAQGVFNYPPPAAIDYLKSCGIAPQKYPEECGGQRRTKGSDFPIQRDSDESYDTPNTSSFNKYRLDSKDIFNFTNQNDPRVAAGQYVNFGGTYSGKYTVSILLGLPIKGTLNLSQNGNQVTGILTTGMGRKAALRGVVQGSQLVGKLIFNDSCAGEGTLIGDLDPTGDLMTGKYRVSDCDGKYSGRYKLKRK
jgi:hypothetical protein